MKQSRCPITARDCGCPGCCSNRREPASPQRGRVSGADRLTARRLRPDKHGAVAANAPRILDTLGLRESQWQYQVLGIESRYFRAIGCADALIDKAKAVGQCWRKGLGTAQRLVRQPG